MPPGPFDMQPKRYTAHKEESNMDLLYATGFALGGPAPELPSPEELDVLWLTLLALTFLLCALLGHYITSRLIRWARRGRR